MNRFSQLVFDFVFERKGSAPSPRVVPTSDWAPLEKSAPLVEPKPESTSGEAEMEPALLTKLCRQWCQELGLSGLAKRVSVQWNTRLKTTAGTASPQSTAIDLNCRLKAMGNDVLLRILKHELAHLVAHHRAGRRKIAAHGPEWRQACTDLGIPGEKSRHTLPFKSSPQRRKFAYQCPQCSDVVLRVRKFSRYSACWSCCKKHNRGRYAERYQFVQIPLEKGTLLHAECGKSA